MKFLKIIIRTIFRFILVFLSFVLLYLFMSCFLPYVRLSPISEQTANGIEICIQSNGIHTDFIMPVKNDLINWNKVLPCSDFDLVDSSFKYIAVGWGDKGFFLDTPTWADFKFSTGFNAAFGLGSTAMHVAYKRNIPKVNESCKKFIISKEQYAKLITYILNSFKAEDRKPILINHAGYTSCDKFYEAKGIYSLFNTCNVWTGDGLRYMETNIGAWTPLQGGIMNHIK